MKGPAAAKAAAFFDLDRTLIDVDAGFLFGHHLLELARIERDQAVGRRRAELARQYRAFVAEVYGKAVLFVPLYKLRILPRSRLVRESYVFFRGQREAQLIAALDAFFDNELKERVYPAVRRLLAWHQAQGHATVLVTTGLQWIADRYASILGVDLAHGVTLVQKDGVFTGQALGPMWGRDKAQLAGALAEAYDWDLGQSYAYTDHDSDRHLLELVGHPRPVHPNRRLARLARKRGWPILDFAAPGAVPGEVEPGLEDRKAAGDLAAKLLGR